MNQVAALLVGKAIKTLFPNETYFGNHVGGLGFSCTFSYSAPFDNSLLELLEREVKEFAIQEMQMLSSNAAELFLHLGLKQLAEKARKAKGLVQIARMGDFADFYEGELEQGECFTLLFFEQKKGKVEVFGRAFKSKDQRRDFLKNFRGYQRAPYWGKILELFEGDLWLPRGMLLKHLLEEHWRECLSKAGMVELGGAVETSSFQQYGYWRDQEDYVVGKNLKNWIETSLKKFGLNMRHLKLIDRLGIEYSGPYVEKERGSLYGNLNAFISQLLEAYQGNLPFWLAPEQMRLLVVDADAKPVKQILTRSKIRYTVEEIRGSLGKKTQQALHIKVPYVIFFGKQEEAAKSVTIRAVGSKRNDTMTYEEFEAFIQKRQ